MRPSATLVPVDLRTAAARAVPAEDLHALALRAWELIEEAVATGQMTISEGRVVVLKDREVLGLVQWAAQYRQPASTRSHPVIALVGRTS